MCVLFRFLVLRNLVLSMIKLDPTRRPTIASVLDDLWFKAGGDSVVPPRGTSTHSGPKKETTNIPTPKYSKYSPEPSRKQRQASGVSITSILDFLDDTTNPPPKKDSTTPDYLVWFGLVWFRGLTPQQQPGSYQGGEMMMKSVFWWRKPEHPEETTDLRQVTDETFSHIRPLPSPGIELGPQRCEAKRAKAQ